MSDRAIALDWIITNLPHRVILPTPARHTLPGAISWCWENVGQRAEVPSRVLGGYPGDWALHGDLFFFADADAALVFKMRWS